MIDLTYGDISSDKFIEAFNILLEKDLPIGIAIDIGRSVDVINKELTVFVKVKEELIKKYGIETKDAKGNVIWTMNGVSEENMLIFEPKYTELFSTKFEIPLKGQIEIDPNDGTMKGKQAYLLRKLIKVKE
jgi:hypothetical protein